LAEVLSGAIRTKENIKEIPAAVLIIFAKALVYETCNDNCEKEGPFLYMYKPATTLDYI